jgi:N,N-dimethylformamidase
VPSVAPGEDVTFFVSSDNAGDYSSEYVRLIHGDTNPKGPGLKEEALAELGAASHPARFQRTQFGGHIIVPVDGGDLAAAGPISVHAFVWSTTPERGRQGLVTRWDDGAAAGWALTIDDGCLTFQVGDGSGTIARVSSDRPLFKEVFYSVVATYDPDRGELALYQRSVVNRVNSVFGPVVPLTSDADVRSGSEVVAADSGTPIVIAGMCESSDGRWVVAPFNGKIDSPKVYGAVLEAAAVDALARGEATQPGDLLASWNFAEGIGRNGIPTDRVADVSGNGRHGQCVNQPDRGMTGWNWQGVEEHFIHAPEEYGAIWFHEDSLDDCRWDPDFTLTVPEDLPSGCYAAKIGQDGAEDYIPFFVRPPRNNGAPRNKILLLIGTCSYLAYANGQIMQNADIGQAVAGHVPVLNARDIELHENVGYYGLSTYDYHADGRGVQYSTWRRPILNMRPNHRQEFGSLWQFPADLHLVDWLTTQGYEFDVATDHDLIAEGAALFTPYNVVLTGSHPEYYSAAMIDAWEDYLAAGGRGMYLASNGIYWVVSVHPEKPWLMECRKGETGAKAWQARPGELYHHTTGERGGLWRCRARATQKIWGTGFTSFGFDHSGYFVPMPDSREDAAAWIMEGLEDDETIGDFGLVGGGAGGYELDRYDLSLGTPPNTMLLASSVSHSVNYVVVNEDQFFPHAGMCGGEHPLVRADIVYFNTANGGAMFSTSSISWLGSLSHNDYDNNVSRMMNNVLGQFAKDEPAPLA